MTIRLTLTLPATALDLRTFTALTDGIGGTMSIDTDGGLLVASIGDVVRPDAPTAEPAPEAIAKALPHAAKVKKKAPAKKRVGTKVPGGGTGESILRELGKLGGRWNGSAPAFIQEVGLTAHALNVLPKLAADGRIRLIKTDGGRVAAIELVNAATPANVTALPQPNSARHPATPAPLPVGGIKAPSGGWA